MRRQPQARATKQQARINRFHDLKKEVSGNTDETDLTMNFETSRIGKKVIEFQNVSFAYENKPILQDFNLLVQAKDRIGIVGDNGVGKSTLLNLIAGSLDPTAGQVVIGKLFASPISLSKLRAWMKASELSITCRKWQKRSRPAVVLRLRLQSCWSSFFSHVRRMEP